ncbi:MAG: hypothetical protein R2764_02640 [Bacteroidales bacterium]
MKRLLSYLRNHYSIILKSLLFVASIVILVLVFPKEGKFKYEFRKGKPWMHENLIAPFNVAILKSEQELEEEKNLAIKDLKPYFTNDQNVCPHAKRGIGKYVFSKMGREISP